MFDWRRLARMLVVVGVAVAAWFVYKRWPHEQAAHYILGNAAPRVIELQARWASSPPSGKPAPNDARGEDWTREATFRYAPGSAPRIVTHEMRLSDGDYMVEVEIVAGARRNVVQRRIALAGEPVSIDVADEVPR